MRLAISFFILFLIVHTTYAQIDKDVLNVYLSPTYSSWSYKSNVYELDAHTLGVGVGMSFMIPLRVHVGINRGSFEGRRSFMFDLYEDEKSRINYAALEFGLSYPVYRSKYLDFTVDYLRWQQHFFVVKTLHQKTVFGETSITRRDTGMRSESHNLLGVSALLKLHPRLAVRNTAMFEAYPYVSGLLFRSGLEFNIHKL